MGAKSATVAGGERIINSLISTYQEVISHATAGDASFQSCLNVHFTDIADPRGYGFLRIKEEGRKKKRKRKEEIGVDLSSSASFDDKYRDSLDL